MDKCDMDHQRGKELRLRGKLYVLCLQGRKWYGERWIGSEYTKSKQDHCWYEGFGSLANLATNHEIIFSFCTWEDRLSGERSLRNFILISDRWEFGHQKILPLVQEKLPDLIDYLCEQLIDRLHEYMYKDEQELFPHVDFIQLSYKKLVKRGFIFDESGQIHISI